MKKLTALFALALLMLFSGCAALSTMKTCMDDPVCFQQRLETANKVKTQVGAIATVVSPVPWAAPVVASVAGAGSLLIGLFIGGKKKQEGK